MEVPAMGAKVSIAKFPEPVTPVDIEDIPFWDSVPDYLPPVSVPVDINNLYDTITYKMVEDVAYSAFEGHNSKYDVRNFKKHFQRNCWKIYNSLLDGTYTKYISSKVVLTNKGL